jgi:glycerol-3-phosphate dehydrogenase (NAD(P)+)
MPQANATILGAGSMGTALSTLLAANNYKVTLWDMEEDVVRGINHLRSNPRSLKDIKLHRSIRATHNMQKALIGADLVVFVVASQAVREVASQAKDFIASNCVVVCAAKGLETGTHKTMTEVLGESLGSGFKNQITAFSGPTLAIEIAQKKPTAVMIASERSNTYSKRAVDAFKSDWFKVYETSDVVGVEYSGVAKHTLAIMAGMVFGLGYGSNTYGWLMTEGFRELSRLIWKLGGQEQTVYGIAGLGDALATCFAKGSRNRTFGELLGKGKSVAKANETIGETVEGIHAVDALFQISKKEKLNLPILQTIYQIVSNKKKASKSFTELLDNF